jgi:hypothetical protein
MLCLQPKGIKLVERIRGWNYVGNDNPIFKWPYIFSEAERALVQTWTIKLLDASLVKLSTIEYASTIMIITKKIIFDNWIECYMCGSYYTMNK